MTIYATPFRASDKQCTGPSMDSGFDTIEAVIYALGSPLYQPTQGYIIYGDSENRVIFSKDILFHVDGNDNIN